MNKTSKVPKGWSQRVGFETNWFLDADRGSSQPIETHISSFGKAFGLNHPTKDGFQCTLGEFAGRYCYIAPVRDKKEEAVKDCLEFMKDHIDVSELKRLIFQCDLKDNHTDIQV